MDEYRGVLSSFHDFIQVQDGAVLHCTRHRTVDPTSPIGIQKIAANQVASGKVFMTSDGDQRNPDLSFLEFRSAVIFHHAQGTAELPGHVFHEPGLAATGRPFKQHRYMLIVSCSEKI